MQLSELGKIVDACWTAIPDHFKNTRVDAYQIMPNHLHGILEIVPVSVGTEYIQSRQRRENPFPLRQHRFQHVIPKSLGSIVRSFKAAVTREYRRGTALEGESVWQGDYHDHIIRNPIEHFFIDRYIRLNPVLWLLDSDNPAIHEIPIDDLGRLLREKYALEESEVEYLVRHEIRYRKWKEKEMMQL